MEELPRFKVAWYAVEEVEASGDEKTGVADRLAGLGRAVTHNRHNAGMEGSVIVERLKKEQVRFWLQRSERRVGQYDRGGYRRPCESNPLCVAECSLSCSMFLTTEAIIADKPEKDKLLLTPDMGGMGGMGGMM